MFLYTAITFSSNELSRRACSSLDVQASRFPNNTARFSKLTMSTGPREPDAVDSCPVREKVVCPKYVSFCVLDNC